MLQTTEQAMALPSGRRVNQRLQRPPPNPDLPVAPPLPTVRRSIHRLCRFLSRASERPLNGAPAAPLGLASLATRVHAKPAQGPFLPPGSEAEVHHRQGAVDQQRLVLREP